MPSLLNLNLTSNVSVINFTDDNILKIIRSLNINKAHGYDISIRMITICDKAILEPLSIIYKNCIDTRVFPDSWKKSNIVLVQKKGDTQLLENYRPVSLLPTLGEIFEKILYNNIFEYLQENTLLCQNQSGFRPSNSCQYQLLPIVHEIYASFDCNPPLDVRAVFLDISKAFDGVWHDEL